MEKQLIPASQAVNLNGLKMVKNAVIFQEDGTYFIRHYNTIIFAHNPAKVITEVNWHCSVTSDRQIRNAIQFFGIPSEAITDVGDGSKWAYSGAFN